MEPLSLAQLNKMKQKRKIKRNKRKIRLRISKLSRRKNRGK